MKIENLEINLCSLLFSTRSTKEVFAHNFHNLNQKFTILVLKAVQLLRDHFPAIFKNKTCADNAKETISNFS